MEIDLRRLTLPIGSVAGLNRVKIGLHLRGNFNVQFLQEALLHGYFLAHDPLPNQVLFPWIPVQLLTDFGTAQIMAAITHDLGAGVVPAIAENYFDPPLLQFRKQLGADSNLEGIDHQDPDLFKRKLQRKIPFCVKAVFRKAESTVP